MANPNGLNAREETQAREDAAKDERNGMLYQINIRTGNETMTTHVDVADAVHAVARRIADGDLAGIIRDSNGNTVGEFGTDEPKGVVSPDNPAGL